MEGTTFIIDKKYGKHESVEVAIRLLDFIVKNPGKTIYYSELAERCDKSLYGYTAHNIERLLGDISFACIENGLPPVSAIVVNIGDNSPGKGFFKAYYSGLRFDDQYIKWIQTCKKIFEYQHWDVVLDAYKKLA